MQSALTIPFATHICSFSSWTDIAKFELELMKKVPSNSCVRQLEEGQMTCRPGKCPAPFQVLDGIGATVLSLKFSLIRAR